MITTFESVVRNKASRLGFRVTHSGSPRRSFTLMKRGYVVISPVSLEEIEKFLAQQEEPEQ